MISQVFHVLIVDDSNFFRMTARKMIEDNFRVKIYEASNAFEAMRLLGNHPIDIILLDVNMPEVDGFKAAKVIKHQEKYANIPIIFCTAMPPTSDVIQKSFEVGGIDFLNKPFTENDLVRVLALYFRFIIREREITAKIQENQKILENEIEERKHIAKALEDSELKFRKISSSAYDAIIMINATNNITFWNEAAFRIFGYTSQEVSNVDFIKLISPPGKYQIYRVNFENMKITGKDLYLSKHFEISGIRKGGQLIDLEVSLSAVEIDNDDHFIIVARDITIRKREAQLLEKSEAILAEAEATAHIGSWEFVVESGQTTWSKELFNIYGIDSKSNMPSIDLIKSMMDESDVEMFIQTIDNTIKTGEPYIIETRITSGDGKIKYVEGRGKSIFDANGKVSRIVGTLMDITEKKVAQMKLEKYIEELAESNATKDKFFSIIAHDLRNPFGALKNLTEILSDMYEEFNNDERLEIVGELKTTAHNINDLLENLLTWSRSQRGNIQFHPEEVFLTQLVKNCTSILGNNAESKSITLTNLVDEEYKLICDSNMITTVLRNLISNAIKFTPENGTIKVFIDESPEETIVSVQDNGMGISPKDIEKLFRIDVHHSTIGTSKEKGTGLGLILCKEFIEKHNGRIWVESELEKGSTFKFSIPKSL